MADKHALLVTLGTDGDVFPSLGLGLALRERGYRVTLATSGHYEETAAEHGFGFAALVSKAEAEEVFGNPDFWHPRRAGLVAAKWGVRFIRRQFELLADVCGDATVIVANPGVVAARVVQERFHVPLASMILQPWFLPSVHAPPILPGGLTLPRAAPRWMWRAYWRLLNSIGDRLISGELNRVRASAGLPPMRRLFDWWYSPDLILGMFPEWFGPTQPDWPQQVRLCGFPMYDGRSGANMSNSVREFCTAGEPPVVFTFGTGMKHASKLFRAALDACIELKIRALLVTRFPEQLPETLPSFMHRCDYAPFQELFPLCRAAVHHGGIGTTARALRSGIPQVIVPICYDQLDNATRVNRLGAGVWVQSSGLDGARLAQNIASVFSDRLNKQARAVTHRFEGHESLNRAADSVEQLVIPDGAQLSLLPER